MAYTGNEDFKIDLVDAKVLTRRYRGTMSTTDKSGGYFGKSNLIALLSQDTCVGIRYYYGLDENNVQVLVIVGVDSNQNDLLNGLILERSFPCPTSCGEANELNSD